VSLRVISTKISNTGLAYLKDCSNLTKLYVDGTPIDDVGLSHLKGLTKLVDLGVKETRVTAKGLADFDTAVPGCKIDHDGGAIPAQK